MPVLGGAVDFRILGPLEVVAEGRFLDIGAPKLRAVLAALLLEPNRVVSDDRLIESVWDETPPESAQKALQVYVSQLRKLLGGERVQRIGPGYALRVDPGELDLDRFERLRDEGKLHEALALWRGPPLAEFEYERFARSDIERLEELRLACLEERLDGDLAEGWHAKLISELEQLAAEHPQRERLRAQLMLALYRSGRQAEALEAYQDARRELVETLGIDPGRPLRELEQAILRQDPSLDLAPPTAVEAIAQDEPRGVFVGRESEVAELLAGLEDAFAGRGRLFLIAGEPGIGKSRLTEELTAEARRRGALVLVGRCWEAGGAPAYWPWVQALRAYIGAVEQAALKAQLGAGGPDLLQLLPELGGLVSGTPAPDAFASEGARFRLFDAMAVFLRNAAVARPLVLVLDDLHAADEPSLLLLRFLARELGASRLLVAAAYRDVDPELRDPLTTALAELGRERVTRTLSLGGLDAPDIASFIELTTDRTAAPGLATTLYTETAGNPLFVGEIVRLLAAEGRLDDASAARLSVPENVRGVIGRRLDRLSDGCASLLGFASVFGREFDLDALARLGGFEQTELLELLDEAVQARVVSELPGAQGRMRFAHALIRDTVYEGLGRARRAQLHRQAGEAVEALHAGDRDSQLTELAYHFSQAAPVGDVQKAVDYCRLAGDRAIRLLAYEEAVRLFRMALALTRAADATRCEVLLAIGDAQARSGDAPASKQTFQEAAELAGSLGLSEQLGRAALGYGGRIIWDVSRDADYLESVIERALAALPDEDNALRVKLLARLACGPLRGTSAGRERKDAVSRASARDGAPPRGARDAVLRDHRLHREPPLAGLHARAARACRRVARACDCLGRLGARDRGARASPPQLPRARRDGGGQGRAGRDGEARGNAQAAGTAVVRDRLRGARDAARGRARGGGAAHLQRPRPRPWPPRAGTPWSRSGSSSTCCAPNKVARRRSKSSSTALSTTIRPTRSGAAWRLTSRRGSDATMPSLASKLLRATVSPTWCSTRNGSSR